MRLMKYFLAVCLLMLLFNLPSSWAGDYRLQPDPSKKTAAGGSETLDAEESLRLAIEYDNVNLDYKSDILLAQSESGIPSTPAAEFIAETKEADTADEQAKIAKALANPLSYLWLLFMQNDTKWYDGDLLDSLNEDAKVMNTTLLQPVLSMQLTEEWKTIFRPVFQIHSFDTVGNVDISTGTVPEVTGVEFDRKWGLGDTILWTAFSNQYEPPFVFGFGPTIMLPTATDDQLGTGKWSAGPMALAFSITDNWILGGVLQHWWSFAGEDDFYIDTSLGPVNVDRSDVNLTDFQYVIRYRYSNSTNIGIGPNIQYNWETDELSLPVGMGFDTLVKIGKLPVKVGAELYYYVVQDDDFGPQWQLRLFFVPVVPAPDWSRKPLF
jgi:hypothetical protein